MRNERKRKRINIWTISPASERPIGRPFDNWIVSGKTAPSTLKGNHTALHRLKNFSLQSDTAYLHDEAFPAENIYRLQITDFFSFSRVLSLFICTGTDDLAFAVRRQFVSLCLKRFQSIGFAPKLMQSVTRTKYRRPQRFQNNNAWDGKKKARRGLSNVIFSS